MGPRVRALRHKGQRAFAGAAAHLRNLRSWMLAIYKVVRCAPWAHLERRAPSLAVAERALMSEEKPNG